VVHPKRAGLLGLKKPRLPIVPLNPDQLWKYDLLTTNYYSGRHRELPTKLAAVVHPAATEAK